MTKRYFLRGGQDERKPNGGQKPSKKADALSRAHARLQVAETNFISNKIEEAQSCITSAMDIVRGTPKAPVIYLRAIHILEDNDLYEEAAKITQRGVQAFPDHVSLAVKRATQLSADDKPSEAIELLAPIAKSNQKDTSLSIALARAYLVGGKPAVAMAILKPLANEHPQNETLLYAFANACATTRDRQHFDRVKKQLPDDFRIRYLEGKLFFFEGSGQKAIKLLEPIVQDYMPAQRVTSLFMACVGDKHPIHEEIKSKYGTEFYDATIRYMHEWRKNPARAEARKDYYSNSQTMWQEGAIGASGEDNRRAGLGKRSPVAVKGWEGPNND